MPEWRITLSLIRPTSYELFVGDGEAGRGAESPWRGLAKPNPPLTDKEMDYVSRWLALDEF